MRPALKLNAIEQEHLQEVYDSAGVARDDLPYTEAFDKLCQEFQDRTFKNAEKEQVYSALLKYVRSSTNAPKDATGPALEPELTKQLKSVLKKHGKAGKVIPYSSEFEAAQKEFSAMTKKEFSGREFWEAVCKVGGKGRRPPTRTKKVLSEEAAEDGE